MLRPTDRLRACLLATLLLLLLAGCERPRIVYVDEDRSYTDESALALSERLNPGELAEKPADESKELRHDALVQLRGMGPEASEAAELITATFSSSTQGVPFYVERATYGSKPVIVMVEAIGPPDGRLLDERVWVLGEGGEVLLSGTR